MTFNQKNMSIIRKVKITKVKITKVTYRSKEKSK